MNKKDMQLLFRYARESILKSLNNESFSPERVPKVLNEKHGIFVTLTINDELRGCIGLINPVPLFKGVVSAAKSSAFSDPRFVSLSEDEFKEIIIEISILSVPVKSSYSEIKKGDGVIINLRGRSALFLPQVWDELPDKESFMSELSLKAGLEPESFKSKEMHYEKFSVEAWKELTPNGDIKKVL